MAVGIRRMSGRLSAAKPCACSAAKCVWLRRLGRFVRSAFSRILCIVHLYAVKTTEKGSLGTLLYRIKTTCTQSKKHLYAVKTTRRALCTSPAVGLLKSVDRRSRDSARVPKNAKETPSNLEGCEADERPCPDRGLDPPLELYCW
jgi:hypothetical protein